MLGRGAQKPDQVARKPDRVADQGADAEQDEDPGVDDPWRRPAGDAPESDGEGAGEAGTEDKGGRPATLTEAAERLGMKPAEVYDLAINTGDGETVTLGQLKDAWQDRQTAVREGAKKAVQLDQREAAIVAREAFYGRVQDELQSSLTPQRRAEMVRRYQADQARERQSLVRAMPELSDPGVMTSFLEQLGGEFERHGFRPGEMQFLDHRFVLMARDLMRANARIERWSKYEPERDPPRALTPQGRGGGAADGKHKAMMQRARQGTTADKVTAVEALIKGR